MVPYLNEATVQERIDRAKARALRRRSVNVARSRSLRQTSRSLRHTVGRGLIAIGERLVDQGPVDESGAVRRAA